MYLALWKSLYVLAMLIVKSMQACLPSEVKDDKTYNCWKTCPPEKFVFQQRCIESCPLFTKRIETELAKYCLLRMEEFCPINLCRNDYRYCYKRNCLQHCPEFTVEYNYVCLIQCPKAAPYLTAHSCDGICLTGNKSCSASCPVSHPYMFDTGSFVHCLKQCPSFTAVKNKTCEKQCDPLNPFLLNNSCLEKCPESHKFILLQQSQYNEISLCVSQCPQNTVNDGETCVDSCPSGKHLFNNTCVLQCPDSHKFLHPRSLHSEKFGRADYTCVDKCEPNRHYFGNVCVSRCPQDYTYLLNNTCVSECPHKILFIEPYTQRCVEKCNKLSHKKRCVDACPYQAKFVSNSSCQSNCTGALPFEYTKDVKKRYWSGYYGVYKYYHSHYSYTCVDSCPSNTYLYENKTCEDTCPEDKNFEFGGICFDKCPNSYFAKLQNNHYQCWNECLNLLTENRTCVTHCSASNMYRYNSTCIDECPANISYFKEIVIHGQKTPNYLCMTNCSKLYYKHQCFDTCPVNTYMFSNHCVEACPSEFPFIKSNPRSCVQQCNNLYFKEQCVENCPKEAKYTSNSTCQSECKDNFPYDYTKIIKIRVNSRYSWQSPTYTDSYTYTCVDSCPGKTVLYNNASCVTACPKDKHFEFNGVCLNECPTSHFFKKLQNTHYKCVNKCSDLFIENRTCVSYCSEPTIYRFNNTCIDKCPENVFYLKEVDKAKHTIPNYFCMKSCDNFYHKQYCVNSCPRETYLYNENCVDTCPSTHPMNYTMNSKGYGLYRCVQTCPKITFIYKNTCFDKCPSYLRTHGRTCKELCPQSHPYTDIRTKHCVQVCSENYVITDENYCDKKCPSDKFYIESGRCVKKCKHDRYLFETTPQGRKCHVICPNHLLLLEGKGECIANCPSQDLIVESICKPIKVCPFHTYIEHSTIGRRCTNRCSLGFFQDGLDCVKKCPPQKVIAGSVCSEICPPSLPLSLKHFSGSPPRVICYSQCPEGYLANGTSCIDEITCQSFGYSYNHICYEQCPYFTKESGYKMCVSMLEDLGKFIVCFITGILAIFGSYVIIFLNGQFPWNKVRTANQIQDPKLPATDTSDLFITEEQTESMAVDDRNHGEESCDKNVVEVQYDMRYQYKMLCQHENNQSDHKHEDLPMETLTTADPQSSTPMLRDNKESKVENNCSLCTKHEQLSKHLETEVDISLSTAADSPNKTVELDDGYKVYSGKHLPRQS